ncbi:MAG: aldo/keto reductase [Chloroflexota bacterium]|nr:aldo/keto reductase [Chloroflexota bacterium]
MQYRKLGDTGPEVSALGFGGWPMGGARYGSIDNDLAVAAIGRALDLGVTLFDTAVAYGLGTSESLMGNALQGHWDDIVVVTKTGVVPQPDNPDAFYRDSRPETIRSQCEFSLKALGTDFIDVYLIHWPDFDTPRDETMRAMEDLKAEGKIGHVGVSNFSTTLMDECLAVSPIVANQVGYHMLDRRHADEIIPYCAANGIGVMAYGSLAHGVLTGAFKPDHQFEEGDWRGTGIAFGLPLFHPDYLPETLEAVDEVTAAAEQVGLATPQLALRWVLDEPAISTALVGFRTPAEVDAAVDALEADLPDGLMSAPNEATFEAYQRLLAGGAPTTTDQGPGRRS